MTDFGKVLDNLPDDVNDELMQHRDWMLKHDPGNVKEISIRLQGGQWRAHLGEHSQEISVRIAFIMCEGDREVLKQSREFRGRLRMNARNARRTQKDRSQLTAAAKRLGDELNDAYKLLPLFTSSS